MAERSESVDSRPLRDPVILIGLLPQRNRNLNDWLRQTPTRHPETQSGCHAAQAVAHASAKID
jgi:hypothetical protein